MIHTSVADEPTPDLTVRLTSTSPKQVTPVIIITFSLSL